MEICAEGNGNGMEYHFKLFAPDDIGAFKGLNEGGAKYADDLSIWSRCLIALNLEYFNSLPLVVNLGTSDRMPQSHRGETSLMT